MRTSAASSPTSTPTPRSGWSAIGTLPFVGATLVALNGPYILLVAFGNITDYAANQVFVHHVMAMDTTNFGAPAGTGLDPDVMWRAITNPSLQTAAYLGVIVWVLATAVVLWIRGRNSARRIATAGLLMIVLLFFGGFIDIGGDGSRCGGRRRGTDSTPRSATRCSRSDPRAGAPARCGPGRCGPVNTVALIQRSSPVGSRHASPDRLGHSDHLNHQEER